MSDNGLGIVVDDAKLTATIGISIDRLENPEAFYRDIGESLVSSTRQRFLSQTDPKGNPWIGLQPEYLATPIKSGSAFPTAIMRLHGYLMGSITFQASPDQLVVGSAMIYAAQRQFGGVIVPKQAKALAFQWGPEGIRLAKSVTQPGRAFIGISDEDREDITAAFHDYITGA